MTNIMFTRSVGLPGQRGLIENDYVYQVYMHGACTSSMIHVSALCNDENIATELDHIDEEKAQMNCARTVSFFKVICAFVIMSTMLY